MRAVEGGFWRRASEGGRGARPKVLEPLPLSHGPLYAIATRTKQSHLTLANPFGHALLLRPVCPMPLYRYQLTSFISNRNGRRNCRVSKLLSYHGIRRQHRLKNKPYPATQNPSPKPFPAMEMSSAHRHFPKRSLQPLPSRPSTTRLLIRIKLHHLRHTRLLRSNKVNQ